MKNSRDYHDYVFRDGKLVGEFELMYKNSKEIPWHQDKQDNWVDVRLTIEMLKDCEPFTEIHDLSCGLGYHLDLMIKHIRGDAKGFGYDVPKTACAEAALNFPEYSFQTLDLTVDPESPPRSTHGRLFLLRGTLWYIFPKIAKVVAVIRRMMSNGDRLLVVQNWPPLGEKFIGKEIFPDHHAAIEHFSSFFTLTRHIWYADTVKTANDNWFIGLFDLKGSNS